MFATERWDPGDDPEMSWDFPVPSGTNVQVRLYFINQYDGTSQVGQRVFNVSIDGTTVLPNFDIVADTGGDKIGEMKSFNITSDGDVNIDFGHITENPLVNAIEIVNPALLPGPQPIAANFLSRRSFDGSTLGSDIHLQHAGDRLVAGSRRVLPERQDLRGLVERPSVPLDVQRNDARTPRRHLRSGQLRPRPDVAELLRRDRHVLARREALLHASRAIRTCTSDTSSLESQLYGSVEYTVSGPDIDGLDWSGVKGLTEASDHMYWQTDDGVVHQIDFSGGAPVGGTESDVGAIGSEGSNGLFVLPS